MFRINEELVTNLFLGNILDTESCQTKYVVLMFYIRTRVCVYKHTHKKNLDTKP